MIRPNKFARPILLAAFFHCAIAAAHEAPAHLPVGKTDVPASHGMQILGTDRIYAYHIADHAPHDYQLILELQLDEKGKAVFLGDQKAHPEYATYSIEPEFFVLPEMLSHPKEFNARLYRGNYTNGKGGVLIDERIGIRIKKIVYLKKFDPAEPRPDTARFILWGDGREQFAAHYLTAQPDFDQVVQTRFDRAILGDQDHALVLQNAEANIPVAVTGNVLGVRKAAQRAKVAFVKQLYFEPDYIDKYYDIDQ